MPKPNKPKAKGKKRKPLGPGLALPPETSPQEKPKRGRGRPPALEGVDLEYVERLARANMTIEQIAVALKVSKGAVKNTMDYSPDFLAAIKKGREFSDRTVEASLYARAVGYYHPATHFASSDGVILTKDYIKFIPPDVTACIIWLKNRKPEKWKDRLPEGGLPPNAEDLLKDLADSIEQADGKSE